MAPIETRVKRRVGDRIRAAAGFTRFRPRPPRERPVDVRRLQLSMAEADTGHDHDSHYEEVLLSDMTFEEEEGMYYWECPCGDMFEISQAEIDEGQDIAHCPSCSLTLRVLLPPPAQSFGNSHGGRSELVCRSEADPEVIKTFRTRLWFII